MEMERLLTQFFELENRRDWEKYKAMLHPQIERVLFSEDEQQTFCGVETYMEKIEDAYCDSDTTFVCKEMIVSSNGSRIVAVLQNSSGAKSVEVFEFREGLIIREYEFLMGRTN